MIPNIQYLRAFAALSVVFFHIIGSASAYDAAPKLIGVFEGHGASGVDIFFVISGYIMMHSTSAKNIQPFAFARKRFFTNFSTLFQSHDAYRKFVYSHTNSFQ